MSIETGARLVCVANCVIDVVPVELTPALKKAAECSGKLRLVKVAGGAGVVNHLEAVSRRRGCSRYQQIGLERTGQRTDPVTRELAEFPVSGSTRQLPSSVPDAVWAKLPTDWSLCSRARC